MTDNTTSLSQLKVFSGSALKLIACMSMLSDHLAKFYFYRFQWANMVWFTLGDKSISLLQVMLMFGRFAFPIFVFLLVEGFENTKNKRRYGLSLLVLAVLSEIPYNLMNGNSLLLPKQNVMFTLLLGYLAMCSLDYFKNKPVISLVLLVVMFLISRYMYADYRTAGFVFILLMYGLRKEPIIKTVASPVLFPMKLMVFLSLVLTCLYNGKRGFIQSPFLKYCFYAFYPVHMLVIYFLARQSGL
jgi:hypothetical protein